MVDKMGKLVSIIVFVCVLLGLLHFSGLMAAYNISTPSHVILDLILKPDAIQNSSLFAIIDAALLLGGAGIVIGSFLYSKTGIVVKASIAAGLLIIAFELVPVYLLLNQISRILGVILISPIIVVFLISVVEWWNGHD